MTADLREATISGNYAILSEVVERDIQFAYGTTSTSWVK
jgi:hypothetical protein